MHQIQFQLGLCPRPLSHTYIWLDLGKGKGETGSNVGRGTGSVYNLQKTTPHDKQASYGSAENLIVFQSLTVHSRHLANQRIHLVYGSAV